MKACKVYSGYNSSGAFTQIAESESGEFFTRSYGFNGYGVGFGAWTRLEDAPRLRENVTNAYTGKIEEIPESERTQIECGFNYLTLDAGKPRVRLPG